MSAADYLAGLAWFVPMLAGTLGAAAIVVRKRLAHLAGAPRAVAFAIVATCVLLAVHVVPGALGVLSRPAVLVATAACVALALAIPSAPAPPAGAERKEDRDEQGVRWIALVGAGAVAVFAVATAFNQIAVAPRSVDLMNFHLPGVASWIQSGSIWHVTELLPNVAPGAYPNNGDVVLLAAVLPWHDDFLAHLTLYPYYALTGLAIYALGRELGATPAWATLGAALVLAVPAVAVPALVGSLVDIVFLATFAGGLLFGARHRRTNAGSDLVLAGLGFGVAFGTKWYAVSAVAIVLVVWALARLVARERARNVARDLALVSGLVIAAGGIWLLRNWIEIGNPFFPVRVEVLGATIFAAPHDVVRAAAGSSLLDYVGDWGPWGSVIVPQLRDALAAPTALLCIGGLAAAVALVTSRASRWRAGRGLLLTGLAAGALLVLAYALTPYTAGGPAGHPTLTGADARYAGPALVVLAAVAAAVVSPVRRWPAIALGAVALVAIADGLRASSGGGGSLANLAAGDWLLGLVVVGAGVAIAGLAIRGRVRALSPLVLGVSATVLMAAVVAGGYVVQRHFNEHRYAGSEPAIDWIARHAPSDERIALAGVWSDDGLSPVLPAFGPRLENHVSYLGRDRGGFVYAYRSERAFAAALRRGAYNLVVVGRGRPGFGRSPEVRWAIGAGFRPVARSARLELLRAPPASRGA